MANVFSQALSSAANLVSGAISSAQKAIQPISSAVVSSADTFRDTVAQASQNTVKAIQNAMTPTPAPTLSAPYVSAPVYSAPTTTPTVKETLTTLQQSYPGIQPIYSSGQISSQLSNMPSGSTVTQAKQALINQGIQPSTYGEVGEAGMIAYTPPSAPVSVAPAPTIPAAPKTDLEKQMQAVIDIAASQPPGKVVGATFTQEEIQGKQLTSNPWLNTILLSVPGVKEISEREGWYREPMTTTPLQTLTWTPGSFSQSKQSLGNVEFSTTPDSTTKTVYFDKPVSDDVKNYYVDEMRGQGYNVDYSSSNKVIGSKAAGAGMQFTQTGTSSVPLYETITTPTSYLGTIASDVEAQQRAEQTFAGMTLPQRFGYFLSTEYSPYGKELLGTAALSAMGFVTGKPIAGLNVMTPVYEKIAAEQKGMTPGGLEKLERLPSAFAKSPWETTKRAAGALGYYAQNPITEIAAVTTFVPAALEEFAGMPLLGRAMTSTAGKAAGLGLFGAFTAGKGFEIQKEVKQGKLGEAAGEALVTGIETLPFIKPVYKTAAEISPIKYQTAGAAEAPAWKGITWREKPVIGVTAMGDVVRGYPKELTLTSENIAGFMPSSKFQSQFARRYLTEFTTPEDIARFSELYPARRATMNFPKELQPEPEFQQVLENHGISPEGQKNVLDWLKRQKDFFVKTNYAYGSATAGEAIPREKGDIDYSWLHARGDAKAQEALNILKKTGDDVGVKIDGGQMLKYGEKFMDLHGTESPEAGSVPSEIWGMKFRQPITKGGINLMDLSQTGTQKFGATFTYQFNPETGEVTFAPEPITSPKYGATLKHVVDSYYVNKYMAEKMGDATALRELEAYKADTIKQFGEDVFKKYSGKVIAAQFQTNPLSEFSSFPSYVPLISPSSLAASRMISPSVSPSYSPSPSFYPSPSPSLFSPSPYLSPYPSSSPSPSPSESPSPSPGSPSPSESPSPSSSPSPSPSLIRSPFPGPGMWFSMPGEKPGIQQFGPALYYNELALAQSLIGAGG